MREFLSKKIAAIKGESYQLDDAITGIDLVRIGFDKGVEMLRGLWKGLFFGERQGTIFVGKRTKIRHAHLIRSQGGLVIGDGVYINALSKEGISLGNNVSIGAEGIIECTGVIRELGEGLVIGNHVGFAQRCFIEVRGRIEIGDNCIFGPDVSIHAENHVFADPLTPIRRQGAIRKGVKVGQDCWFGRGATIFDGVTIGDGCVIAAGAVVTKDVPALSVIGGVPARVIGSRQLSSMQKEHHACTHS